LANVLYFTQQIVTKKETFMNSYATSARYMRVAACALFLSLCGQTKCAGDDINPPAVIGTGLGLASAIIRYCNPPTSPQGFLLDLGCILGNGSVALMGKPNYSTISGKASAIVDFTCIVGLALQYTRLIPSIAFANDPLWTLRAGFSAVNIVITTCRFMDIFKKQN
jgi:hypothetical protein